MSTLRRSPRKKAGLAEAQPQSPPAHPRPAAGGSESDDGDEETTVLYEPNILHSLQKSQLQSLCGTHKLKSFGNKEVLIHRLEEHGRKLKEEEMVAEDGLTQWSLLQESQDEDEDAVMEEVEEELALDSTTSDVSQMDQETERSAEEMEEEDEEDEEESGEEDGAVHLVPTPKRKSLAAPQEQPAQPPPLTLSSILAAKASATRSPSSAKTTGTAQFVFGAAQNFQFTSYSSPIQAPSSSHAINGAIQEEEEDRYARIVRELNERVARDHAEGKVGETVVDFETFGGGGSSGATKAEEVKMSGFDKKHQKEFNKMDSIANHYAAKRPASVLNGNNKRTLQQSTSSSQLLSKSTSSSQLLAKSTSTQTEGPSSKRIKIASTASEKKMVEGLRATGYAVPAPWTDYKSEKEKKEKAKRELEKSKARRKSGVMVPGGRRRSLTVGKQPKENPTGNIISRAFKSTMNKLKPSSSTTSIVPVTSKPSGAPSFTAFPSSKSSYHLPTLERSKSTALRHAPSIKNLTAPAQSSSSTTTLSRSNSTHVLSSSTASYLAPTLSTSQRAIPTVAVARTSTLAAVQMPKKDQVRKKFDLQESLAKGYKYQPKASGPSSTIPGVTSSRSRTDLSTLAGSSAPPRPAPQQSTIPRPISTLSHRPSPASTVIQVTSSIPTSDSARTITPLYPQIETITPHLDPTPPPPSPSTMPGTFASPNTSTSSPENLDEGDSPMNPYWKSKSTVQKTDALVGDPVVLKATAAGVFATTRSPLVEALNNSDSQPFLTRTGTVVRKSPKLGSRIGNSGASGSGSGKKAMSSGYRANRVAEEKGEAASLGNGRRATTVRALGGTTIGGVKPIVRDS